MLPSCCDVESSYQYEWQVFFSLSIEMTADLTFGEAELTHVVAIKQADVRIIDWGASQFWAYRMWLPGNILLTPSLTNKEEAFSISCCRAYLSVYISTAVSKYVCDKSHSW